MKDEGTSFPGSAWERTALEALPRVNAGVSSLLKKGDRHLAAALFRHGFDCCSEPVPGFQQASGSTELQCRSRQSFGCGVPKPTLETSARSR